MVGNLGGLKFNRFVNAATIEAFYIFCQRGGVRNSGSFPKVGGERPQGVSKSGIVSESELLRLGEFYSYKNHNGDPKIAVIIEGELDGDERDLLRKEIQELLGYWDENEKDPLFVGWFEGCRRIE